MIALLMVLFSTASAADMELSAGPEATFNDPFARTAGARVGMSLTLARRFSLGLTAGGYPTAAGGERSYTDLTRRITEDYGIAPDISRIAARGTIEARVLLLHQEEGDRSRSLGVHAGLGGVYTIDDLAIISAEGDSDFLATQRQIHPMWTRGISGELWWGGYGARLRLEQCDYDEIVGSTISEDKRPAWISAEALWRFP